MGVPSIRPVDCGLSPGLSGDVCLLLVEGDDGTVAYVQRGVMVGIVAPCAAFAVEPCVVAVACVHVSAPVASLAGVRGIYHDDADVVACGLVGGELLQLAEAPLMEHVAAASSAFRVPSSLPADVGQVFERYSRHSGGVGELFACTMVDIADEPLFPSLHRLQPAARGPGAFFLQDLPVVRVSAFDAPHVVRFGLTSPRIHGQGMLAQIDAEHVSIGFAERCSEPVDECDADGPTCGVEEELGRVKAAVGVPVGEPCGDGGHYGADAFLPAQGAEGEEIAAHAHEPQVIVDGERLAAGFHVPSAFGVVGVP